MIHENNNNGKCNVLILLNLGYSCLFLFAGNPPVTPLAFTADLFLSSGNGDTMQESGGRLGEWHLSLCLSSNDLLVE